MSKTILVVDDSDSLRQVVNIALTGAGYQVIEACDGKDALSKLTGSKVHLIISDVNMPNMNGIEFVKNDLHTIPKTNIFFNVLKFSFWSCVIPSCIFI